MSILVDTDDMTEEKLAGLLARKLSGEISATELQELNEWIAGNPKDGFFEELLSSYWRGYSPQSIVDKTADEHFAHILKAAEEGKHQAPPAKGNLQSPVRGRLRRLIKFAAAAAILAGLILGTATILRNWPAGKVQAFPTPTEVSAAPGAKSHLLLPDGSKVWLNSDSKLHYNPDFNDSIREVFLEGEAYFDVIKDVKHPFIVHASAIDIRVLGTAFNVKSYDSEKTIETTLIHGLVEVTNKLAPDAPKIILRPREKLVFTKINKTEENAVPFANGQKKIPSFSITALPEKLSDSLFTETSWKYNRLVFDGETFAQLALKMERWFNVKIFIRNQTVANYRLRGMFEDETIDQALQALQLIAPFHYKIKENKVEITK